MVVPDGEGEGDEYRIREGNVIDVIITVHKVGSQTERFCL
jgi:hypothetical protein